MTGPNARPEAAASPADDPQRRFRLASEQSAELGRERAALTEIRDGLQVDERGLRADVSAAQAECLELEAKLGATRSRATEIESEIAASDRSSEDLARQVESVRRQVDACDRESQRLEEEIRAYQSQISEAQFGFHGLVERLAEIDRRLQADRAPAIPGFPEPESRRPDFGE